MADGALASDHVNYLIFRYLQEAGFENAAKSLHRDWHRSPEFGDPERLPFAPLVEPQELIHIIQDGLFYDQLQASVAQKSRKFRIISGNINLTAARNAAKSVSRRQSAYAAHDTDEFPLPPPKRARHSGGSDVVINGDAMDIDTRGKGEEAEERTSPASEHGEEQSEVEAGAESTPPVMMSNTTQTEPRIESRTDTIYWADDSITPGSILHASWNPAELAKDRLFLAGESVCRMHDLSTLDAGDEDALSGSDMYDMTADHIITAAAWEPTGSHLTYAVRGPAQVDGDMPVKSRLADMTSSCDHREYSGWFDMVTMVLRYNNAGTLLLSASTNGSGSVVEVRDMTKADCRTASTTFDIIQDGVVVDAAFISDTRFVVVGRRLLTIYNMVEVPIEGTESKLAALSKEYTAELASTVDLDKVRFQTAHQVLVAASSYTGQILTFAHSSSDAAWTAGPPISLPGDSSSTVITATAFEPQPPQSEGQRIPAALLAVSLLDEQVLLYTLTSTSADLVATLNIGPGERPLALSWAPQDAKYPGPRLAAASEETIRVWEVRESGASIRELLTWKAAPAKWYQADDHHLQDDEDAETEPILAWDSVGERMLLAVGRKAAVVSIVPDDETGVRIGSQG